jgi:hypothetical protein
MPTWWMLTFSLLPHANEGDMISGRSQTANHLFWRLHLCNDTVRIAFHDNVFDVMVHSSTWPHDMDNGTRERCVVCKVWMGLKSLETFEYNGSFSRGELNVVETLLDIVYSSLVSWVRWPSRVPHHSSCTTTGLLWHHSCSNSPEANFLQVLELIAHEHHHQKLWHPGKWPCPWMWPAIALKQQGSCQPWEALSLDSSSQVNHSLDCITLTSNN